MPFTLDKAGTDLARHDLKAYPRSVALRGAVMGCDLYRVATTNVSNLNATVIPFADERWDSDSLHSNTTNNSRITIPPGGDGIWTFDAAVEFSANANGTTREAILYINGGARASDRRPPLTTTNPAPRATVVPVSRSFYLVAGDYVELWAYQDSGTTLTAGASFTFLQARREGDAIGPRISSKGQVLFSGDMKYKGFERYTRIPSAQPTGRVFVTDDPVLGAARQVANVRVTNADDTVTYPRAQFQSPATLTSGDDVYVGLSIFIPADTPSMAGSRSPVIHEIYGPPTTGYGPNVLRIRDNKLALEPLAIYDGTGAATGAFLSWELPLSGIRGKWIDVVHRIKLSADPAVGLHEFWINTGAGWTQQTLKDPTSGASVGTTLNLATLRAGVNDGANNFSSLKVAYTDYSVADVTLLFADHIVATTLESAKPSSYAA